MPDSVAEPAPKSKFIEENVLQPNPIVIRAIQESLFIVLPVENSEPHNWKGCKNQVVTTVQKVVVDKLSWEFWNDTEAENRNYVQYILVEHVRDQVSVAAVSFSTVDEKQILEETELSDGVVGGAGSLLAL